MLRFCILAFTIHLSFSTWIPAQAVSYTTIRVIDEQTGQGVPLVELTTVNHRSYITDSNGVIAFHEPGLMNRTVFFHISSHGYEFPEDSFGYRGRAIPTTPNSTVTLKIKRINIAERLYRVTGQGIYRDSALLGMKTPLKEELPGNVLGSDSVLTETLGDYIYWFWGDTNRSEYPLGNFHVPGARSQLNEGTGLDPRIGIDLEYFVNNKGFAKETCKLPGQGPTWLNCLMKVSGQTGPEQLFAVYMKVKAPLEIYQRGIAEFNVSKQIWEHRMTFPNTQRVIPHGHPLRYRDKDKNYFYFAGGMPFTRVPATEKDILDPTKYEAYTCLVDSPNAMPRVRRDANNQLAFSWSTTAPPLSTRLAQQFVQQGKLQAQEIPGLVDIETGEIVQTQHGSVYFNQFRRSYVMVISQVMGSSMLGEVWFAEATSPLGPWKYARRIITHDNYSFYNPKQHPMLDANQGRTIFFEGTYTAMFSGNNNPTPGYNYNQIMYKLDLTDKRLNLPVPVYLDTSSSTHRWMVGQRLEDQVPEFYALHRPDDQMRKIQLSGQQVWIASEPGSGREALWEWIKAGQPPVYRSAGSIPPAGYIKKHPPAGYVWKR